ncbi:MAG: polyamine aminopropyltransferase [Firmicutes bacterium]|uniref:Polyamine aminopropyltransferase n=1 Tax=Melghirimyces thermohalophilus TaxID=1236220 RepID=A0A1G6RHT1_9BACL|nr:polyamine aminopropyltransferase [Melghirimyces thermohalophilus]MDA8352561.1 polyamine aminopropyltransferase [Bacillota bacterium]SDD04182.1 spermidine synthase [Melghirimyces thermohalophilus]
MEPEASRKIRWIYWSSGIVSICGIIFEILFGALGSYAFGDGVKQYALTIGFFLSGMGLGAYFSEYVRRRLLTAFVLVELGVALIGGVSVLLLFLITAYGGPKSGQIFLVLVTLAVGVLTGMELPILIREARRIGEQLNRSAARVLFFDYAGSLIGAVIFLLLLRPWLGLVRSAFVVGSINALVGLLIAWRFAGDLRRPSAVKGFALGCLALLSFGIFFGDKASHALESQLYRDQVLRVEETAYQRIVVTREEGDTRLYLNGNLQFSSTDEYRYHESLVHPAMSIPEQHKHILVLGGGDGLVVRELLKYPDIDKITLVELDPAVTRMARSDPLLTAINQGALDHPQVNIVHEDAFQYVRDNRNLYDVVIVDLPDPNNESINRMYTVQFYEMLKKRLAPEGALVLQGTSPVFARDCYWTIYETVKAAGLHTLSYHVDVPSFGNWGFVLATREPVKQQALRVETEEKNRYLTEDTLPSLFHFGKDEQNPGKLRPNTFNDPVLMDLYGDAWKHY